MAKAKTSRKKTARKTSKKPAKKTSKKVAKRAEKISVTEGPLPPKQRDKALSKLRKLSIPPTHPSSNTGPALNLGYEAPMPKKGKGVKKAEKRARKK